MEKDDIIVVLQSCIFAMNITEQEVVDLGYSENLVRLGYKLHKCLKENNTLFLSRGFN